VEGEESGNPDPCIYYLTDPVPGGQLKKKLLVDLDLYK
jgi:hypothetical protein